MIAWYLNLPPADRAREMATWDEGMRSSAAERAAILEMDAQVPRADAERLAFEMELAAHYAASEAGVRKLAEDAEKRTIGQKWRAQK